MKDNLIFGFVWTSGIPQEYSGIPQEYFFFWGGGERGDQPVDGMVRFQGLL